MHERGFATVRLVAIPPAVSVRVTWIVVALVPAC